VRDAVTRALIIGGGIGGLTTARALHRAGVQASVYERAPALEQIQVGGAIHLWHNGMHGLQLLDLGDQVAAIGGPAAVVQTAEMRNWRGRLLTRWSPKEIQEKVGAPTVGIIRPDLHRTLVAGVQPGVLELGRECTGLEQSDDHVVARFADGSEERGDILIGADGLRSVIRRELVGAEEPLRFARYASWQALCEYRDEATPDGLFWIVWGPAARFLFYRVSSERLYWEGIFATEAGGSDQPGKRKEAVAARFSGWHHPVEAIIDATDEAAITRADIYDRPPTKRWGEGRFTLLGDAAHPMTNAAGQGANQTIEDAVVLGSRLQRSADAVAALRVYEQERIGRTAKISNLAWRLTSLSRIGGPAAVVRDGIVKMMMIVGKRVQAKDMEYDF
jgi:2-polyprenyl-6-methoxyphenol hydroxylase-like FAD-dependent oxidoreductase